MTPTATTPRPRERPLLHWLESGPADPNRPNPMQRGKGAELRARLRDLSGEAQTLAMLRDLEARSEDGPLYWAVPADEVDLMQDALLVYRLVARGAGSGASEPSGRLQ